MIGVCRSWFVLLTLSLAAAEDEQLMLIVDRVPAHGICVADLPLPIADSTQVPFQYISSGDGTSGTAVFQLQPGTEEARILLTAGAPFVSSTWDGTVRLPDARIHHSAEAAGFPDRVTFGDGRSYALRWDDRLYDASHGGGFVPRADHAAELERVSAGPLATAVRSRARYLSGDKQPPGKPVAVYDWLYLHGLPLARVRAVITQHERTAWAELHAFELHSEFPAWAGGEPLLSGTLSGVNKSHSLNSWGALVDGRHAIGMLQGGRVLVWDGNKKPFGNYLQAHGDRAWKSWNSSQETRAAWLWIGTDADPAAAVQQAATSLPSNCRVRLSTVKLDAQLAAAKGVRTGAAVQLARAGQTAEAQQLLDGGPAAGWSFIDAGNLVLTLKQNSDGIRVVSLRDRERRHEWLPAQPLPLFTVVLRHAESGEQRRFEADSGWDKVDIRRGLQGKWTARWELLEPALVVTVRLTTDPTTQALGMNVTIDNGATAWSTWRTVFPQLDLAEPAADARILFPRGPGEVQGELWRRDFSFNGRYPDGWTSMPFFAAYTSDGHGLYAAVHDAHSSTRDLSLQSQPQAQTVRIAFDQPLPDMSVPGNDLKTDAEAVIRLFSGDWFDATVIYRDWARKHAAWYPKLDRAEGRRDTPLWMRELPIWLVDGGDASSCVPQVKAFAEAIGLPVGFHWYNWHQNAFDNDYPHFFPARDGFADGVAELQTAGVHVMPYINGHLWDTRDRGLEDYLFSKTALPAAAKDLNGRPYLETYSSKENDGSQVQLAAMCPKTELWQRQLSGLCDRLFNKVGVHAIYLDQIAAAKPNLCYDASHGHPLGGGNWWTAGYGDMLEGIRREMPWDRVLTTECNAEAYARWFDGYLTWHWQHDGQVPAFSAVYGGAIQMFGRAYRGGPDKDLALRMKCGQQLVFGEQLGWLNPNVVKEQGNLEFLRAAARVRWELRRFFYAGEMARPPILQKAPETVQADWRWRGEWPVRMSAVQTGAWLLPQERKLAAIAVNVADTEQALHLDMQLANYGLVGDVSVTLTSAGARGAAESATQRWQPRLQLPPRSVRAWILQQRP